MPSIFQQATAANAGAPPAGVGRRGPCLSTRSQASQTRMSRWPLAENVSIAAESTFVNVLQLGEDLWPTILHILRQGFYEILCEM